jgi:hypothetical protein
MKESVECSGDDDGLGRPKMVSQTQSRIHSTTGNPHQDPRASVYSLKSFFHLPDLHSVYTKVIPLLQWLPAVAVFVFLLEKEKMVDGATL